MKFGFQSSDFRIKVFTDLTNCELLTPIYFRSRSGVLYEAPVGTRTDFASTPKIVWGLPLFLIPTGWWAIAAAVHDAAFRNMLWMYLDDGVRRRAFAADNRNSERAANKLLLEMMQALKPNPTCFEWLQYRAIYLGVTLGGWHAFKHDRAS